MRRDIYQRLIEWSASDLRKPLILRGARQVGKTYVLQEFGQNEYKSLVYLNFDEMPELATFFEQDLDPLRIIQDIELFSKQTIIPGETLVIFDEIQECEGALKSLKYFCEKANDYHVIAAGSLLGVKLVQGFPVGKVNFLDLKPLSFPEFLEAVDEVGLRKKIEGMQKAEALPDAFHQKLIQLLKQYYVIGGMPEVINVYCKHKNYALVRQAQREVLDAYALDFSKHAPPGDVMKIMAVWEKIPEQLSRENKKFIFSAISQSARAREYESAIQWLEKAGMVIQTLQLEVPQLPLSAYANTKAFKIYLLDVGLLGAFNKLDPSVILEGDALFKEFKGALTENYVAQAFSAMGRDDLYYWVSQGTAEVDFIIEDAQQIYPLEVKAGISRKKKSLKIYYDKYLKNTEHSFPLLRASLRNFAADGGIVNYPLYAVSLIPKLNKA